jgi:ABC-type transport system involved in multi-copper enzyme maturation permease subunit
MSGPRASAAIVAISLNTFREAVRDRILYLILAFAVVMILASRLLSMLTVGEEIKIIKDLGLSTISVFGLLTSVFVGVSLVFKEIDKRTVYTLLAKPVKRWQFITGKYGGLLMVLAMNVAVMALTLSVLLIIHGENPLPMLEAVLLILVELSLVTAFAILFSSFANPILSALGTAAIYVVGHLVWSFDLLKDRLPEGWSHKLCDILYWVLPNLDRLNIKTRAVHGLAVSPEYIGSAVLYGLSYSLVVLVLACIIFERRDFN